MTKKENKVNLQKSFKKKLSKQKKDEVKHEYKEETSELKAEFKKLKADYKKDVKAKKKLLKTQYKSIKHQLKKSNADLVAHELEEGKTKYVQTSFDLPLFNVDSQPTEKPAKNAKTNKKQKV